MIDKETLKKLKYTVLVLKSEHFAGWYNAGELYEYLNESRDNFICEQGYISKEDCVKFEDIPKLVMQLSKAVNTKNS